MNQVVKIEKTWPDLVHDVMPQFERIARQNQMVKWDSESQFAIQAIQKNDTLAKCTIESVQNAVINVAAVGLTLNPADGYAYLVPEYNKQTRNNECQLRISFKGLIKVATDTGAIKWVKAEIVKANDTFEYRGISNEPVHTMNPFSDRGDTVGVYCVAKTNEGEYLVDIMSSAEIEMVRGCAKTDAVWAKWPDEMAKKAVIKRASKQWPKTEQSSVLHKAVEVINNTEGSDFDEFAELEKIADAIFKHLPDGSSEGDRLAVGEIWTQLSEKEQSYLWTAKTKGGFFTQDEKVFIRESCTAFHNANQDPIDGEATEVEE